VAKCRKARASDAVQCRTLSLLTAGMCMALFMQQPTGAATRRQSPKNVIVMISDGCGFNHVAAAGLFEHGKTGAQPYEAFPVRLAMSTYAEGYEYVPAMAWRYFNYVSDAVSCTDSAAAATSTTPTWAKSCTPCSRLADSREHRVQHGDKTMKQIRTEAAPAAIGPYSQAITEGPLIFTSGQLPIDPATGELCNRDIATATRQVLRNLQAVLVAGGADMSTVIKTTVFLKDMRDFQAFNGIYAEFFKEPFPARSCVQVAALPKDALVEIEAMAVRK